jgi:hypothetical protein|tara:strand:+ start:1983 stop:2171 length:189 start_codon:yes stop_codon:yes gene_type:complete
VGRRSFSVDEGVEFRHPSPPRTPLVREIGETDYLPVSPHDLGDALVVPDFVTQLAHGLQQGF